MKMPFGRYKGIEIADIPESYLRWCVEHLPLSGRLERSIRERLGVEPSVDPRSTVKRVTGAATDRHALDRKIKSWFRELALAYHPDRRGGSNEAMVALLDANARLRKALDL